MHEYEPVLDEQQPVLQRVHSQKPVPSKSKKVLLSALALTIALVSFVGQTESAAYIANSLGYRKPILMLYLTHSSWTFMLPLQIFLLWFTRFSMPFPAYVRRHLLTQYKSALIVAGRRYDQAPVRYFVRCALTLAVALNFAGSSWYIAVNLTTPSDLTAIYNCSAFFAYAFAVPILGEKASTKKTLAVLLAILGTLVVAYSGGTSGDESSGSYPYRVWGNLLISVGAVLYGLYEVLYKYLTCPLDGQMSSPRQAQFANVVGSLLGLCTLSTLWILIPILHFTGLETFELPTLHTSGWIVFSVVCNVLFSGSFLVLMSLTSPVLSSVAALLTVFLVAVVDFALFGEPITAGSMMGSILIIIAFLVLSYATMIEDPLEDVEDDDDDDDQVI